MQKITTTAKTLNEKRKTIFQWHNVTDTHVRYRNTKNMLMASFTDTGFQRANFIYRHNIFLFILHLVNWKGWDPTSFSSNNLMPTINNLSPIMTISWESSMQLFEDDNLVRYVKHLPKSKSRNFQHSTKCYKWFLQWMKCWSVFLV